MQKTLRTSLGNYEYFAKWISVFMDEKARGVLIRGGEVDHKGGRVITVVARC